MSAQPIPVDKSQVEKAARALLKHLELRKKDKDDSKSQLFDEDDTLLLAITLKKIPDRGQTKPILIPLKHPLMQEQPEMCLFVKDPKKEAKDILDKQDVHIAKVINISKLRKEYHRFEERRKLLNSYRMFLVDDRIVPLLPRVLGKTFFKRKKQPVPINLQRGNIAQQIQAILHCTLLFLSAGDCIVVKIGLSSHTAEEITENVMFALPHIVSKLKDWKNIQALHLKSTDSVALPFFASLPKPVMRVTTGAEPAAVVHQQLSAPEMPSLPAAAPAAAPADSDDDDDEDDEIEVKPVHKTKTISVKNKQILLPPPPKGRDNGVVASATTPKRKASAAATPKQKSAKKGDAKPRAPGSAMKPKPKSSAKKARLSL